MEVLPKVKQNKMEMIWVAVGEVKTLPYNPPNRTEEAALKALKDDIALHGIRVPLIVNKDFMLVDGHRRLTCAKALGITSVPVVISYGSVEEDYSSVNITQKAMSDKDLMWIYVNGGPLSPRIKSKIKKIEEVMGEDGPTELLLNGCGPGIYAMATRVARYCGDNSPEFTAKSLRWLMEHKAQFSVRRIIDSGTPPNIIVSAIEENRALRNSWGVA